MKSLALSNHSGVRIEPLISYHGGVPEFALEMEVRNPFFTFWFIESGGLHLTWRGGGRSLGPGELALVPPLLRRRHRFQPGSRIVSLSFSADWGDGVSLLSFRSPLFAGGSCARSLGRTAQQTVAKAIAQKIKFPGMAASPAHWLSFRAALDHTVSQIFAWACEQGAVWNLPQCADARLHGILTELSVNPRAGSLPIARWQKLTRLSRVHLDRLAVRELGESLSERRNALLIGEVRRAISEGRESFKEMAARLGFYDAAHFTRWVRSQTGKSPSRLRQIWR